MSTNQATGNLRPAHDEGTGASPLVAICILNWNGWQDTLECLESVRNLSHTNYLVVVVDNGSLNESLEELRAWGIEHFQEQGAFVEYRREDARRGGEAGSEARLEQCASHQRLVLINNEENLGFNGGCNVVFRYALMRPQPAEYLFLLNNDATLDKDCLKQLIQVDQKTKAGIVGAVIKTRESGAMFFAGNRGSFPLLREFFSPLLTWPVAIPDPEKDFQPSFFSHGAGVLIRKDVLEAVHKSTGHYFDEAYFIYGGDDLDLSEHARKSGYSTVIANRALVYHGRASSSGGLSNPIVNYYPTRNRVRAARNLLPWPLRPFFHALHISWSTGRASYNLLKGRRRSALAIFRGLADGYRGVTGKWQYHDEEVQKWLAHQR